MTTIRTSSSSSRSLRQTLRWLTPAVALSALSLGGIWELSLGGAHRHHLITIFLALFLSGVVVLACEFLHSRKALADARLSHDTLRKALLAGNSVAWDLDVKTGRDRWFGDLKTMFGMSADTFTGERGDFYRYVHPNDRRRVSEAVARAQMNHSPYACEFRVCREDGTIRWASATGEFQYSKKGEPVRMLGIAVDITERVHAQELLRESEERFRRVVEHIGDAVFVDDVEGRAVFANDRFLQLFGFQREQLQSIRLEDLVAPQYRAEVRDRHDRRMRGETVSTNFEHEGIRFDGTRMWLEVDVVPIADREGKLKGTQSAIRDISARKRAEKAILDSELRLRHLIEASNDWVFEMDETGAYTYAGPQCFELLGYKPEELIGKRPMDFMPPDEPYRSGEKLQDLFEKPRAFSGVKTTRVHKDGRQVIWETNAIPIFDEGGGFRGYRGLVRDVTERHRAETELRESEERFRLVANTAPVMIWMVGTDNQCTYLNKRWLEFTGRELAAELGNGWLDRIHPDDLEACVKACKEGFENRATVEVQYRLLRHDGQYRWILDFGVPRFNPDGSFAGYIGSCIDITERKRAEEAMATIGRRLIEAHEEERTWIGRELHDDINQRLAFLSVELDRSIKNDAPKAEVRGTIQQVQQRVTEIARDVQNLSHRLHSSKLEYLGLARAANSFCKELSQQSNVEVVFRHKGVPPMLPQEISLSLFRVLQEALQNAVKHSGVKSFTVDLCGVSDSIDLVVVDTGSGFDPAEAVTGKGLGLISMRERLEIVHGEFSVHSKPGTGTTIHAHVPLPKPESRALAG
jgi:PAS domain S-box-containing protein